MNAEINNRVVDEIFDKANTSKKYSKIVAEYNSTAILNGITLVLGNNTKQYSKVLGLEIFNKPLFPATCYNISIVVLNVFKDKKSHSVYHINTNTGGMQNTTSNSSLWILLLIPLILLGLLILLK